MKPLAAHGQSQGQGTLKQPSQAIAKLGVNRLGEKHIYGCDFAKQVKKILTLPCHGTGGSNAPTDAPIT